jgi:DNA-binding XRE family transcriptional regulator
MADQEINDTINELKAWIKEEDRTEAYLARKLGVSPQRLHQWMNGETHPNLKAWLKIKEFLRKNWRRK